MFSVVLDANVLYPLHFRDLLLYVNLFGPRLYTPIWSDAILDEVGRNLVGKGRVSAQNVATLLEKMKQAYPDAVRNPPVALIQAMSNEVGDRHVLATAVHSGSEVIVTQNGRHFSPQSLEPYGIEVQTPDEFLLNLLSLDQTTMVRVVQHLQGIYTKPPYSQAELLEIYAAQAPKFADSLAQML